MNSDYLYYKSLYDKQRIGMEWCGHCAMIRSNLMPFQKRIFLEMAVGIAPNKIEANGPDICPKCGKLYNGIREFECGRCTLERIGEQKNLLKAPSTNLLSCLCL